MVIFHNPHAVNSGTTPKSESSLNPYQLIGLQLIQKWYLGRNDYRHTTGSTGCTTPLRDLTDSEMVEFGILIARGK